jgi:hypothetical protein
MFYKRSSVINSIYSGQQLFSYTMFRIRLSDKLPTKRLQQTHPSSKQNRLVPLCHLCCVNNTYKDFTYKYFNFNDFIYNDFIYNNFIYKDFTYKDFTYKDFTYKDLLIKTLLIKTLLIKTTYKDFYKDFIYNDFIYNDFIYNNFTYNINKCDITYMFFYFLLWVKSLISKISYE